MINTLIFTVLVWEGIGEFGTLMEWLLPEGGEWWIVFSRVALWVLFAASALLIIFFSFTMVANLIGAPFNGLLSEKIEKHLTGRPGAQGRVNVSAFIKEIPGSILNEFHKLAYFVVFGGLVLALSLIPVVNIAFPVLWILFVSRMALLEYMSYPMENHGLKFKEVKERLSGNKVQGLGFGLAVMVATMIPLVNFLIMPAAVAGATVMWVEQWRQESPGEKGGKIT